MYFMNVLRPVLALCLSFTLGSIAQAAPVVFQFEAVQDRTIGTLEAGTPAETASLFATIQGSFGYDDSAIDTNPDATLGAYAGAFLSINQFGLPTAQVSGVDIGDGYFDRDLMTLFYRTSDLSFRSFVNFADFSETAFSSDALPQDLTLADFAETAEIGIFSNTANGFGTVYFELTSLTRDGGPTPVPLPASSLLYVAALGGLAWVRRRRSLHVVS